MTAVILWLAGLGAAALWYLLTGADAALITATVLALWAAGGIALTLPVRRRVRVSLSAPRTGTKRQPALLTVQVHSGAWLPVSRVRVWLRAENLLTGQTEKTVLELAASRRHTGFRQVRLDAALCGVYRLTTERIRLYDPLGLVGFSLPAAEPQELPVEPDLLELRLNLPLRTGVSDDSDTYSQERPGYDFSDTFQLREYAPGDSPRQIHWKLSARMERLVVREPGLPLERSVLLLWERRAGDETPRQAAAMAELLISLTRELLRQGVRCTVAWNDVAARECARYEPEDESALYEMLPRLLSASASPAPESVAELYLRQYGRAEGKTVLVSACGCPGLEQLCRGGDLVGLFCGQQPPEDFPGRACCIDPEETAYELDLC